MFDVGFDAKDMAFIKNLEVKLPKQLSGAVKKTASVAKKEAKANTKKVTGDANKSWVSRKSRQSNNTYEVYSLDVAARVLDGGRKAQVATPKKKRNLKRKIKTVNVKEYKGAQFVDKKVIPKSNAVLEAELLKLVEVNIK